MQKKRKWLWRTLFWALAIGWVAVLFFFSGQTAAESGKLSLWLTHLVQRLFPWIPLTTDALEHLLRKLAHFSIFALEGFLLCLAMMESSRDKGAGALLSGILCTAVAAANELHQSFIEGRSCEGGDVLIDSAGALLGIAVAALAYFLCRRRRRDGR